MKTIKAILIDVVNQKVSEITIKDSSLKKMYELIGNGCSVIEAPVQFAKNDVLYMDEEGFLKPQIGGFQLDDWVYSCTGNGIIVGTTAMGNDRNVRMKPDFIEKQIIWRSAEYMERQRSRMGLD